LAKVATEGNSDVERIEFLKDKVKDVVSQATSQIWQRSEMLEGRFQENVRKHISDFSLETLGDTSEINELRAEIASLRAELVQLRSSKISA